MYQWTKSQNLVTNTKLTKLSAAVVPFLHVTSSDNGMYWLLLVFTCLESCLSTSSGAVGVSCRLFSGCHFSPVFCPLTSTQNHCDRFCGQGRVSYAALTKKLSHACGVCQTSLHDHGLPLLRGFGQELDLFSPAEPFLRFP